MIMKKTVSFDSLVDAVIPIPQKLTYAILTDPHVTEATDCAILLKDRTQRLYQTRNCKVLTLN